MKLLRGCDAIPDGSGLVCRQTRVGGVVMALIYASLLWAMPIFAWWVHAPRILVGLGALLATGIMLFFWGDVQARFRSTNWVLWIRPDRLLVNLRSYQDRNPLDALSVLELADSDVAGLRRTVARYSVPDSDGGSVGYKLESLDIELRTTETDELAEVITTIRRQRQPEQTHLGFIRSTSGVTLHSVSLASVNTLRIAWYGGQGHAVSPRLSRALKLLSSRFTIGDAADERRPDWKKASDDDLDDQILALVNSGNRMDAIRLLVQHRGYTLTDAHKFVAELSEKA